MPATLSILGLYRINPNLFSEIELPETMPDFSQETLEFLILQDLAELEMLYPDPDYMQTAIGVWSRSRMPAWQRMYNALWMEYNPLWNKDAHILEKDTLGPESESRVYGTKSGSMVYGQKQNSNAYGARSTTHSLGARHAEGTNSVSAFNSSTYEPAEKSVSDQNAATDSASELAHTDTITEGSHTDTSTEQSHTDTISTLQHIDTHERTEQGNIGVTTSQRMLEAEMKVRAAYDLYQIITSEFKNKFCIMVY